MNNILMITPSAQHSQLNVPAKKYRKLQHFKPKLGIPAKGNSDGGSVNLSGKSHCKQEADEPLNIEVKEELNSKRQQLRLEYHTWLASKLADEGRVAEFANSVKDLREAGENVTNLVEALEMNAVCAGFGRQIEQGDLYLVLESLIILRTAGCHPPLFLGDHGRELIVSKCGKLLQAGNVEECVSLLQSLSDCLFSIKDFVKPKLIIKQCLKLKKGRLAVRYVSLLPHPHVWFNFLIREFGKQRDLMSALIAFRRSQRDATSPDMYSYRDIIDACGLCGKPAQARILFKELVGQNVTPNVFVYNSLMNVNAGDLNYVLQIYKHMQNSGVATDVTTYNILLKICCIAGKVDWAEHFYRQILSRAEAGDLKMDVITYSTTIQVFGKAKKWALAMEVKEKMLAAGITPDVVTWTSLIGACASAGLVEKAIQVFDEMVLSGCEPNAQCCNTVLHACVESCQYARAFQLFNTWMKNGFYNASAESHKECVVEMEMEILDAAKLQREDSSYSMQASSPLVHNQVLSEVSLFKPTVVTYNILMKACGSAPYFVKSLIEEMEMLGLKPDRISWSNLIDAYGNANDLRGVLKTLNKMHKVGAKPDVNTYTTAIKACVKNKNPEKAFLIFEEMKKYGLQPNAVTYNTLLRARRNYGNLAEVQQSLVVYKDMRKAGYAPNDNLLKRLLEEWAEGVIQHNNCENQDQLFNKFVWKEKGNFRNVISYAELLQKIIAHACPDNTISLIRVDGLTKTEARIAVLAVLRILKEQHSIKNPIKNDLKIITGIGDTKDSLYDAIVKVFQEELGLVVHSHRDVLDPTMDLSSGDGLCEPIYHQTDTNMILSCQVSAVHKEGSSQPGKLGIAIRRPPELQWLTISSESLNQWLGKKRTLKSIR